MSLWASSLPGFDRTRHQISNIETKIKENKATATADVTANHYLDEMFWQIARSYEYGLVKEDGQWVIDKMTFLAESEQGDRDVIDKAVEQASSNPSTYIQRQQTKQAVINFKKSLEDKDKDMVFAEWHGEVEIISRRQYKQQYGGLSHVVDGKIKLFREYYDPIVFKNAFGLDES